MSTIDLQKTQQAWSNLTDIIFVAYTEEEYKNELSRLKKFLLEYNQ